MATEHNRTWPERLQAVIGPSGYADSFMRRSLQTVVLFEAMRCIEPHLEILRPFQRRALFLMHSHKLLDSLNFLSPQQKEEVLWRTEKSREALTEDQAWSRFKTNQKYLRRTLQQLQTFMNPGRSHKEAVDAMMRQAYIDSCATKSGGGRSSSALLASPPPQWEYFHNHTILTLRLYYNGDQLVADFPRMDPDVALVPLEKPKVRAAAKVDDEEEEEEHPPARGASHAFVENVRDVGHDNDDDNNNNRAKTALESMIELVGDSKKKKRQRETPGMKVAAAKDDDGVESLSSLHPNVTTVDGKSIRHDAANKAADSPEPSMKKRSL